MSDSDKLMLFPDHKAVDAAAVDWLLTLEEGDISAEEHVAFLAWRNASPLHRDAFDRVCLLWAEFGGAAVLADFAQSDENAAQLAKDVSRARWGFLARRSVLAKLAASVALIALIGSAVEITRGVRPLRQNGYHTAVGEQRTIDLPDGSVVELNTDSRIEFAFASNERQARLSRGEAYFDVAPDETRPFTVQTANGSITAIGTAFAIRVRDDEVGVLVAKGRVALLPAEDETEGRSLSGDAAVTKARIEIDAGQSAVFRRGVEKVQSVEPQLIAQKLAWRQGVLAFSATPLYEVVDDVNRYTNTVIVIEDEALRNLAVTGYFEIGKLGEMFEALEVMADLKAERRGSGRVYLTRKQES
ncbi:MAG: FecR domain-containing protein [Amphiplicatus sp.]